MQYPLIVTKLHIPQPGRELVARPRLVNILDDGVSRKLTLLSAPAGYGKTSLLCAWLAGLPHPPAWISLDALDNEPALFWSGFIAALQTVRPEIGSAALELIALREQASLEGALPTLLNDIAARPDPLTLVLDDFHLISEPVIHQGLTFFIDHTPSHFHLVIASRCDPPWALARLRSLGQLTELRLADLRFTPAEAADFLNRLMRLRLPAGQVSALEERTEGWIAGLQMAAISLQHVEDSAAFISAFTGNNAYIFDFLLEEVLNRQSPQVRDFLLKTSLLDRLSAPLCAAMLAEEGEPLLPDRTASVVLDTLLRQNLFVTPLDAGRSWYQYHQLFADLLRSYLQQNHPHQIAPLHRRASAWFEAHGQAPEAIHHALEAGDHERVVRLVEQNAFSLLDYRELNALMRWLDALPNTPAFSRPWLAIARAWLAAYTGQVPAAHRWLLVAEQAALPEGQVIRGHAAAIRAYLAWIGGEFAQAVCLAQEALARLPLDETLVRSQVATTLGLASMNNGDYATSEQALGLAIADSREFGHTHVAIFAYTCRAFLCVMQGRLQQAMDACREGLGLVPAGQNQESDIPVLGSVYADQSMIYLARNELEKAVNVAQRGVDLCRKWGQSDSLHFAYTCLIDAQFACGDTQAAFETAELAQQLARQVSPWFKQLTFNQIMEMNLAAGNSKAVRQWAIAGGYERISETDEEAVRAPFVYLCYLADQKQYHRALGFLELLLRRQEDIGAMNGLLKSLLLKAIILAGMDDEQAALDVLRDGLALAVAEGYIRPFVAFGQPIRSLLCKAIEQGLFPEYARQILAAFPPLKATHPGDAAADELIEPLSRRELEILLCIARGETNDEIAQRLVIAVSTVKKHVSHILQKLSVSSRRKALQRARSLGIIA